MSPVELRVGETTVRLMHHGDPNAARTFINLHENERTSIDAGLELLAESELRLYHFDAGGNRRITFNLGDSSFEFDPNRIFTPAGIENTLYEHNGAVHAEALDALARFGESYREALGFDRSRVVVALHNTGDDYSVRSYEHGGDEAHGAEAVSISREQHRHDFFFVTERPTYDALVARGYNAVLQKPVTQLEDDGSLSVFCARREIPYVNVEARYELVDNQLSMLRDLCEILDQAGR